MWPPWLPTEWACVLWAREVDELRRDRSASALSGCSSRAGRTRWRRAGPARVGSGGTGGRGTDPPRRWAPSGWRTTSPQQGEGAQAGDELGLRDLVRCPAVGPDGARPPGAPGQGGRNFRAGPEGATGRRLRLGRPSPRRLEHVGSVVNHAREPDGPGVAPGATRTAAAAATSQGAGELDVGQRHLHLGRNPVRVEASSRLSSPRERWSRRPCPRRCRPGPPAAPDPPDTLMRTPLECRHIRVTHPTPFPAPPAPPLPPSPPESPESPGRSRTGIGAAAARECRVNAHGVDEMAVAPELVGDDDDGLRPDEQLGLLLHEPG